MNKPRLFAGLDLGKVADFSTLAVVERFALEKLIGKRRYSYQLRWLETWELGTPYTTDEPGKVSIVGAVKKRFETDKLKWIPLAIDQTGVGHAVVDMVRAAKVQARITPVVITAGHTITVDGITREVHLPKKELVSTLLVLLEAGLLKWPGPSVSKRPMVFSRFEKELLAFRETITRAKNVTFGAEQSSHDDLVMGVALAVWLGEHSGSGSVQDINVGSGDEKLAYTLPKLPEPKPGQGASVVHAALDGTFASVAARQPGERRYDSEG